MNRKTYNYFCEEGGVRGIEATIKIIQYYYILEYLESSLKPEFISYLIDKEIKVSDNIM